MREDDDRSEVYELLRCYKNSRFEHPRFERFPPRHSYGKL
jgi:hypothetical protein